MLKKGKDKKDGKLQRNNSIWSIQQVFFNILYQVKWTLVNHANSFDLKRALHQ